MIQVLAIITAKPGKRDELLAAFNEILPEVHAEDGCIEYAPFIDDPEIAALGNPFGDDSFVVCEKWASADHLAAHSGAPHMTAFREKVQDIMASMKLHLLSASS